MIVIETEDLKELLRRAGVGEFGHRNEAAIACAALWGLTASELSLVMIGDVLEKDGTLKTTEWVLPGHSAFNGVERILATTHPKHIKILEQYLEWRLERGWGVGNLHQYRGFNPKSPLLLNDKGQPFSFTSRSTAAPDNKQPSGMNTLFRKLIAATKYEGMITYKDFRRSFMVHLHRPIEGGQSVRQIMEATGIRDYESVKAVVGADPVLIADAVRGIYKKL